MAEICAAGLEHVKDSRLEQNAAVNDVVLEKLCPCAWAVVLSNVPINGEHQIIIQTNVSVKNTVHVVRRVHTVNNLYHCIK